MKFVTNHFVRWADLDAFGHVNNASYLVFAQEARFLFSTKEYEAKMGETKLVEMVVARAEVDYIEPIYDGATYIDVAISVESIGNSSFKLLYEITGNGVTFANVRTVQVAVAMDTKKSRPLTEKERAFLEMYLVK
jgi:acyl-CoA thioester hydrolase